jgi:hypothetical protein
MPHYPLRSKKQFQKPETRNRIRFVTVYHDFGWLAICRNTQPAQMPMKTSYYSSALDVWQGMKAQMQN